MPDEVAESAKEAIQEVAKTIGQEIQTIEKFGKFFARIMGESIVASCGMLAHTLKLKRLEHQIRLIEKIKNILDEKTITGKSGIVSPKLVFPISRGAPLEEENSLHDIRSGEERIKSGICKYN